MSAARARFLAAQKAKVEAAAANSCLSVPVPPKKIVAPVVHSNVEEEEEQPNVTARPKPVPLLREDRQTIEAEMNANVDNIQHARAMAALMVANTYVQSTTAAVPFASAPITTSSNAKKRKTNAFDLMKKKPTADGAIERPAVFIPKTPSRNERTAGGHPKPQGVVFACTYQSSRAFTNILDSLKQCRFEMFPFVFTATGLDITARETNNVMMMKLSVPASSFANYQNLNSNAIMLTVSSAGVAGLKHVASDNSSISFFYDQYGNPDECLAVRLYPRFEQLVAESVMQASFKTSNEQLDELVPNAPYQYRISVPIKTSEFFSTLNYLSKQAGIVTLMLADKAFEVATVGQSADMTQTRTFPAKHDIADPLERQAALDEGFFVIDRLPDADPRVTMGQMRGHRFAIAYLRSAMLLADDRDCASLTLYMGIQEAPTETGFAESLLYLDMSLCENEGAPIRAQLWICPRYDD